MGDYVAAWPATAFTARGLNQAEANAALMLQRKTNCAFAQQSASRAIGSTYTNDSGVPRLLIISISVSSVSSVTTGMARATLHVEDPGDGRLEPLGSVALEKLSLAAETQIGQLYGVVNPGGTYTVSQSAPSGVSITVDKWLEFDFGAVRSAYTWAHEEGGGLAGLNAYAAGVNGIVDRTGAVTYEAAETALGSQHDFPDALGFLLLTLSLGGASANGTAALSIENAGNPGLIDVGRISSSNIGLHRRQIVAPMNYDGDWQITNQGGTVSIFEAAQGRSSKVSLSGLTAITFIAGPGQGSKFISLDENAAKGCNVTKAWARTEVGHANVHTPSATAWSIGIVECAFNPAGSTQSAVLNVNATGRARTEEFANAPDTSWMMLVIVPPNTEWSVTLNGATLTRRFVWVVAS